MITIHLNSSLELHWVVKKIIFSVMTQKIHSDGLSTLDPLILQKLTLKQAHGPSRSQKTASLVLLVSLARQLLEQQLLQLV